MNHTKYIILGSLLLTACAQAPVIPESEVSVESEVSAEGDAEQEVVHTAPFPNVTLSNEVLYQYLLAEIAGQRGHAALAAEASVDLARKTRDPRIAMRAAQLAVQSGQPDQAIAALKVWREIEPDSPVAARTLSVVLLRSGKLGEAQEVLQKVLQQKDIDKGQVFFHTYQMIASYPERQVVLDFMRELAKPHPGVPEAHWSVAQSALAAGEDELALAEARQARTLRPEWDLPVLLEAHLLRKSAPKEGLDLLRKYLSKYPDATEVRLQYARALLEQKQYKESQAQFQKLADEMPDNPEMAFAIALISIQLNDLKGAETQLQEALSKGKKDQDTVQYYLGQLSEAREAEVEAIEHYRQVKGGEHHFTSQLRVAYLLNKRGQIEEARKHLHQIQPADNQQRVQLVLVEAQILRGANQQAEAYKLLKQNQEKLPNHPELLYETGMAADLNGDHELAEKLLRKLIQIKPDYAHAYNALGYSLLERKERIPEALELVKKALQLAPDDPAIMDSVGWGYYRSGDLDESVKILRRAYGANQDAEIAAHLGEVLWQRGDKEEAKRIWQESLKANPGNQHLQAVMKRFMP